MSTPFLSQISLFSFNFAPKSWAMCNGQLLPINQNQALFSLLGTTFGGDGKTNFALPDLRGRLVIGAGNHLLGNKSGSESIALSVDEMGQHQHALNLSQITIAQRCTNTPGNQRTPVGNVPAMETSAVTATYSDAAPDATMSGAGMVVTPTATATSAGGGQSHENRQPILALNYCIALNGIFPSPS